MELFKILIRVPKTCCESLLLFPFLSALAKAHPNNLIQVIYNEGELPIFEFLPFKTESYFLPLDKNSPWGIHHFAYNLHEVFNIDLFLDAEGSILSALLGFAFRAHQRVGLGDKWASYFYTKKQKVRVPLTEFIFFDKYKECFDKELERVAVGESIQEDNVVPLFEEKRKRILIASDRFDLFKNNWSDIFNSIVDIDFYFWDINNRPDEIKEFFKTFDDKNGYHYIERNSIIALKKTHPLFHGVLTDSVWSAQLLTYFGKKSFALTTNEEGPLPVVLFNAIPLRIRSDSGIYKVVTESEILTIENSPELVTFLSERLAL